MIFVKKKKGAKETKAHARELFMYVLFVSRDISYSIRRYRQRAKGVTPKHSIPLPNARRYARNARLPSVEV